MSPRPLPALDLRTETFTDRERREFLAWYTETHGDGTAELIRFVPFMVEHEPGSFKRFRRHVQAAIDPPGESKLPRAASPLTWLHLYLHVGNGPGAAYEALAAGRFGAHKGLVTDVVRVALSASGPLAWNPVVSHLDDCLRSWPAQHDESTVAWPRGWQADPAAFRSGIDLETDSFTDDERRLLLAWYETRCGGVPSSIDWLLDRNPAALKAQRNRFEKCLGPELPVQMATLLLVQHAAFKRSRSETRATVALARSFGVEARDLFHVLTWNTLNLGGGALDDALDAAGDLLGGG